MMFASLISGSLERRILRKPLPHKADFFSANES